MTKYSAYIDTTILANWILYYKKRDVIPKAEKKIIESFTMLELIEKNLFICKFVSSTWAMCEVANVILNDILTEEMNRNGISLVQFPSQKRVFQIENESKKRTIIENLADFRDFLKNLNVKIRSFEVDDDSVTDLLMKHTFLPTPDALHLSFAFRSCDMLVTLDARHFLHPKHRKQIQDTNKIEIWRPYELIEHYQKKNRRIALQGS